MKRLFVDQDGTIARFHDVPDFQHRHKDTGFFLFLKPFSEMAIALRMFIAFHPEVLVYSLSAVDESEYAKITQEKNIWMDKVLPEIPLERRIYNPITKEKSELLPFLDSADYKPSFDFLLDDFNKNLREWQQSGRRSIKCKNNINMGGTGHYGGDVGSIWDGAICSNQGSPIDILTNLEQLMDCPVTFTETCRIRDLRPQAV